LRLPFFFSFFFILTFASSQLVLTFLYNPTGLAVNTPYLINNNSNDDDNYNNGNSCYQLLFLFFIFTSSSTILS